MIQDDLIAMARAALAGEPDHMVADDPIQRAWLIAQLACWPARADERCTTNTRFLMMSAAATLLSDRDATPREREAVEGEASQPGPEGHRPKPTTLVKEAKEQQ